MIAPVRREEDRSMATVMGVGDVQEEVYGRFGWFVDPEGNKVELWEPATP